MQTIFPGQNVDEGGSKDLKLSKARMRQPWINGSNHLWLIASNFWTFTTCYSRNSRTVSYSRTQYAYWHKKCLIKMGRVRECKVPYYPVGFFLNQCYEQCYLLYRFTELINLPECWRQILIQNHLKTVAFIHAMLFGLRIQVNILQNVEEHWGIWAGEIGGQTRWSFQDKECSFKGVQKEMMSGSMLQKGMQP